MSLNRTTFFAYVRKAPFGGKLTQGQVNGMTAILDEWERRNLSDMRWLAYMLATAFHETATRMEPVIETRQPSEASNPSVKTAIARLEKSWKAGKLPWVSKPYWRLNAKGLSYLGRGLPQLTHEENYRKLSQYVGVDLVANPDKVLDDKIGVLVMFEGMLRGLFSGRSLDMYFGAAVDDPVGARYIVNGKEKASLIASYHKNFLDAINAAIEAAKAGVLPVDVTPADAKPDDIRPVQSKSLWTIIAGLFTSGAVSVADAASGSATFFGAIGNPWALLAFVAVLAAAGMLAWLLTTGRIQFMAKGS